MKPSQGQNSLLEQHALLHALPVKMAQYRRHVVEFSLIAHKSHSSVHYGLQFLMCYGRNFIESTWHYQPELIRTSATTRASMTGLDRQRLTLRIRRRAPEQTVVTLAV